MLRFPSLGLCAALLLAGCPEGTPGGIERCPKSIPLECPGLDQTFGAGGWVVQDGTQGGEAGWGCDVEIDGLDQIVVAGWGRTTAGYMDTILWRFDGTGALDPNFGIGGSVVHGGAAGGSDDQATAVAIDGSGKILAAGTSRDPSFDGVLVVWRFDSSGALDPSFGSGGVVLYDHDPGTGSYEWATALALDAAGNILVTGGTRRSSLEDDTVLLRLDPAGILDPSFGMGGVIVQDFSGAANRSDFARAIVVDSSGRILLTGHVTSDMTRRDMAVWRFDATGALDPSFGSGGLAVYDGSTTTVTNDIGSALALDPVERILVAGEVGLWTRDAAVWRLDTSGVLDPTFGIAGVVLHDGASGFSGSDDAAFAIGFDASGRIVVGGSTRPTLCATDMAIWRLDDQGMVDGTFGCQGVFVGYLGTGNYRESLITALEFDSFGRIVAVGPGPSYSGALDFTIWRLRD